MLYMPKYRYIVISTEGGELVVYKMPNRDAELKVSDQKKLLVTEFKAI